MLRNRARIWSVTSPRCTGCPYFAERSATRSSHRSRCWPLPQRSYSRFPQVSALIGLATVQLRRDQVGEALPNVDLAIRLAVEAELPVLEGNALNVLACLRLRQGRASAAITAATSALALHRRTGHRPGEARGHLALGAAYSALSRPVEAVAERRAGLRLRRAMGVPGAGP